MIGEYTLKSRLQVSIGAIRLTLSLRDMNVVISAIKQQFNAAQQHYNRRNSARVSPVRHQPLLRCKIME